MSLNVNGLRAEQNEKVIQLIDHMKRNSVGIALLTETNAKQMNNIVLVVYIADRVDKVVKLVNHWAEDEHVSGVIEFDRITKRDLFKEVEQQIYSLRIVRK